MKEKVKILQAYDGLTIIVDNRHYSYTHDDDYGANAFSVLFKDLGYDVEIEEDC